MEHTYTRQLQSIVNEITNENLSSPDFSHDLGDNTDELKELVNEFNRSFSEGLTIFLKQHASYDGDPDNCKEKWAFIQSKLKSIGAFEENDRETITKWLKGPTEPNVDKKARDRIYRLCFALSISIDDVDWFFNRVCFQRSFNCCRIEEAVYYYFFKNKNYDYKHAQQLISEIQAFPEPESPNPEVTIYTTEIQQQLDHCSTEEDLKQYFKKNKCIFQKNQAHQRAKEYIYELLEKIQGKKTDKEILEQVKDGKLIYRKNSPEFANCGLIVQEVLLLDEPHKADKKEEPEPNSLLNCLYKSDIDSIPTMLRFIYGSIDSDINSKKGIDIKKINLPQKRRKNFPIHKFFYDLDDLDNYDIIRKCLILLTFYQFWCEAKLSENQDIEHETLYKRYLAETNDYLTTCGYDELYPGNNYDRLFILCSSGSVTPLEAFRNFLLY